MDYSHISQFTREATGVWRGRAQQAKNDIRRLDAASRPTMAAVVALGTLYGVLPLGALIALFRLIDAVTGARAVRVQTTDLERALVTLAVIWVVAITSFIVISRLRGVVANIANDVVTTARSTSLVACMFIVAPWMTALAIVTLYFAEPHRMQLHVRVTASGFLVLVGVVAMRSLVAYLLSRDVTVGSFLLFAGSIVGTVTWMLIRLWQRSE